MFFSAIGLSSLSRISFRLIDTTFRDYEDDPDPDGMQQCLCQLTNKLLSGCGSNEYVPVVISIGHLQGLVILSGVAAFFRSDKLNPAAKTSRLHIVLVHRWPKTP